MKASPFAKRPWLAWLLAAALGLSAGTIAHALAARIAASRRLARGAAKAHAGEHPSLTADENRKYRVMLSRIAQTETTGGHLSLQGYLHLKQLAAAWLQADLAGGLNSLKQTGDLDLVTDEALAAAIENATHGDVASAAALCSDLTSGNFRDKILRSVFVAAAETDPVAALQSLSLLPPHLAYFGQGAIAEGAVSQGGWQGLKALIQTPETPLTIINFGLHALAETNPAEALQLAVQTRVFDLDLHPEQESPRHNFFSRFFGGASKIPAAQRLEYLQLVPPDRYRDQFLDLAISDLAKTNPAAFETALARIEKPAERDAILAGAAGQAAADPDRALPFLEAIASDHEKMATLSNLVANSARKTPEAALDWALDLDDPREQLTAVQTSLVSWMRTDPCKALDYIAAQVTASGDSHCAELLPEILSDGLLPTDQWPRINLSRLSLLSPQTRTALQGLIEPNVDPSVWKKLAPWLGGSRL